MGAAVGDALGAPAEPLSRADIDDCYGPDGITGFEAWGLFPAGSYTDDTQLTIATAEGLLRAVKRARRDGNDAATIAIIYRRYIEWFIGLSRPGGWRGPGRTCIEALGSGRMGTIEEPINDSKGNGGLMRAAPAGLVGTFGPGPYLLGAGCAAITHGHPTGYLAAGCLAQMVSFLVVGGSLEDSIAAACARLSEWEPRAELMRSVEGAIALAGKARPDLEAITSIGPGAVAEEALGIALLCALRHREDFADAVLAAVNHGGDSDTTGSVTGAMMGAALGIEAIPPDWVQAVEDRDHLMKLADDMHAVFREGAELGAGEYEEG